MAKQNENTFDDGHQGDQETGIEETLEKLKQSSPKQKKSNEKSEKKTNTSEKTTQRANDTIDSSSNKRVTDRTVQGVTGLYGGGTMITGKVNGEKRIAKIFNSAELDIVTSSKKEGKAEIYHKYLVDKFDIKADAFLKKPKAEVRTDEHIEIFKKAKEENQLLKTANSTKLDWQKNDNGGEYAKYRMGTIHKSDINGKTEFSIKSGIGNKAEDSQNAKDLNSAITKLDSISDVKEFKVSLSNAGNDVYPEHIKGYIDKGVVPTNEDLKGLNKVKEQLSGASGKEEHIKKIDETIEILKNAPESKIVPSNIDELNKYIAKGETIDNNKLQTIEKSVRTIDADLDTQRIGVSSSDSKSTQKELDVIGTKEAEVKAIQTGIAEKMGYDEIGKKLYKEEDLKTLTENIKNGSVQLTDQHKDIIKNKVDGYNWAEENKIGLNTTKEEKINLNELTTVQKQETKENISVAKKDIVDEDQVTRIGNGNIQGRGLRLKHKEVIVVGTMQREFIEGKTVVSMEIDKEKLLLAKTNSKGEIVIDLRSEKHQGQDKYSNGVVTILKSDIEKMKVDENGKIKLLVNHQAKGKKDTTLEVFEDTKEARTKIAKEAESEMKQAVLETNVKEQKEKMSIEKAALMDGIIKNDKKTVEELVTKNPKIVENAHLDAIRKRDKLDMKVDNNIRMVVSGDAEKNEKLDKKRLTEVKSKLVKQPTTKQIITKLGKTVIGKQNQPEKNIKPVEKATKVAKAPKTKKTGRMKM
jgi:hypothetical protein